MSLQDPTPKKSVSQEFSDKVMKELIELQIELQNEFFDIFRRQYIDWRNNQIKEMKEKNEFLCKSILYAETTLKDIVLGELHK